MTEAERAGIRQEVSDIGQIIFAFRQYLPRDEDHSTIGDLIALAVKKGSINDHAVNGLFSVMYDMNPSMRKIDRPTAHEIWSIGFLFGVFMSETGRAALVTREDQANG